MVESGTCSFNFNKGYRMKELTIVHFVELGSAVLIFIAALIPVIRIAWSKFSGIKDKSNLIIKILGYGSISLYFIGLTIWLNELSDRAAIAVYAVGWIAQVIAYLLEEEKIKGAILSLIVSTVVVAMMLQLSLFRSVIEIQSKMIENFDSQSKGK